MHKVLEFSPWCKKAQIAMINKNMTREDLALLCGFSTATISYCVRGTRRVGVEIYIKVSEILGIEPPADYNKVLSSIR